MTKRPRANSRLVEVGEGSIYYPLDNSPAEVQVYKALLKKLLEEISPKLKIYDTKPDTGRTIFILNKESLNYAQEVQLMVKNKLPNPPYELVTDETAPMPDSSSGMDFYKEQRTLKIYRQALTRRRDWCAYVKDAVIITTVFLLFLGGMYWLTTLPYHQGGADPKY